MKMKDVGNDMPGKEKKYYTVDDILGEEIEIIEDITPDTDVRETLPTEKGAIYFCMYIKHKEEKDLHMTKAALRAIVAVMPACPTLQGHKFKLHRSGKGYETKYTVQHLGKSVLMYAAAAVPAPSPAPIIAPATEPAVLSTLRKAPAGMQDGAFWAMASANQSDVGAVMVCVELLKREGKIINDHGIWRAT